MASDDCSPQEQKDDDSVYTYFPIYQLTTTKVPREYFIEFTRIAIRGYDIRWDSIIPRDRNIEYCYESFKSIRPAGDSSEHARYTHFTFVIVDDQCLNENSWQCIVACDAPDIDEGPDEVKLKLYRLPLEQGVNCLYHLENLTSHPSEASNPNRMIMYIHPPPTMVLAGFTEDGQPTFKPATRAEARKNKKRIIMELDDDAHGSQ